MRKIFFLGFLSLLFIGMSAAPKHMSPAKMQELAAQGKVKQLPANFNKIHKESTKGLGIRSTGQKAFQTALPTMAPTDEKALKKNARRVATRSMTGGADIYGYLAFELTGEVWPGIFELSQTGAEQLYIDPVFWEYGDQGSNGWYNNGLIQGVQTVVFMGYLNDYFTFSYDYADGTDLQFNRIDLQSTDIFMLINAYNPDDGCVYGYAYNWLDDANIWWVKGDFDNIEAAEPIKFASDDFCYSLCYNSAEGCFYGVNINQQFVKVDLEGNQTVVSEVPNANEMATYVTGIVYSPVNNVYYWNYNDVDDNAGLYSITPAGEFNLVTTYFSGEEFTFLFTTDEVIDPTKPERPYFDEASFEGGSLSGTVTYLLPSTFADGADLPSPLNYTALLDGEVYKQGTANPGTVVAVDYTVKDSGFHVFGLYVTVDGVSSNTASSRLYVGNDTPLAPTGVTLTETEISWNPVKAGVNGGYIDTNAITYIVYLNGELIGETSETSFKVTIPTDETLSLYEAGVKAVCKGLESSVASSNKLVAGQPFNVPMYLEPTEDEFGLMIPYDANGDYETWNYNLSTGAVSVGYTWDPELPMDDYLFLPPVEITSTDYYYTFEMEAAIGSSSYPLEYVSVVYATAPNPSSVVGTIIDTYTPSAIARDEIWERTSGLWEVPAPGVYYIALHCTSEGDQYGLSARNFLLEESAITMDSPKAVSDLTAVPGANGALEATVSFKFPTETLGGSAIPSNTNLTAVVTLNKTNGLYTVNGTPGSEGSVKVLTAQGDNIITVEVNNGELDSPKAQVAVYTGMSVPATPTNLVATASADMMSAVLTWDPVTTADIEGGAIDPSTVTYSVYTYVDFGFFQDWIELESGITDTTYTFTVAPGSAQDMYTLGVVSSNEIGSNNKVLYIQGIYLGTPYTLPYESIVTEEEGPTDGPWYTYKSIGDMTFNGGWFLDMISYYVDEYDDDAAAMVGYASGSAPWSGALGVPRFSTKGQDGVEFTINHNQGNLAANFKVYGDCYDATSLVLVGSYTTSQSDPSSMTTSVFELPDELLDKDWVQLYIIAEYSDQTKIFVMTGCEITSATTQILTTKAPTAVSGGKESIIVKGFSGKDITISTLGGVKIADGKVNANEAVYTVTPGIYVVNVDGKSVKVVVR
ncbi:MAG: hypothetical protein J1E95_08665 [Muribaculaceae bacterium]|nr:hypothetical protein [Muribaculaceae bacterium]